MRDSTTLSVQRLMALRQYPGFGDAELAELAVLAENVVEEEFSAGTIVTRAGRVPSLHLILAGKIEMGEVSWGPRELVGSFEAISGRSITKPMTATTDTRTLHLSAADFADILEDNFGLLSNVRRSLARSLLGRRAPTRRPPFVLASQGPLGLVDRLLALRHQPQFVNGRIQALAALAESSREVRWPAGQIVTRAGEPAIDSYVVIEGAARAHGGGRVAGPGDAVGALEGFAEVPHRETVETLTEVRALVWSASGLLDVIEDHPELGLNMIASIAGELLDQPLRDDLN